MAVPLVTQRRSFDAPFFMWLMDVISSEAVVVFFFISVLLSMGRLRAWLLDVPMSVRGDNEMPMLTRPSGSCASAK